MSKSAIIGVVLPVAIVVAIGGYIIGYNDGKNGRDPAIVESATAAEHTSSPTKWSSTKPYPHRDVYYPGTEELKPDEMRVIACGTGMPIPRLKQAAACFLVELGNGEKFIFDMGAGSNERIAALGIPYDQLDKVFLGHRVEVKHIYVAARKLCRPSVVNHNSEFRSLWDPLDEDVMLLNTEVSGLG